MSTENIRAFLDKAKADPPLRQAVMAIDDDTPAAAAESLARLAVSTGHPFTATEFLAFDQARKAELSEVEMSQVAGGFNRPSPALPDKPGSRMIAGIKNFFSDLF